MKCILWKSAGEQPSDKLIKTFHAKKIDGYYVGELTQDAIKNCKKSFTVWKPQFIQLNKKEQKIISKLIGVDVKSLTNTFNEPEETIPWILDTYPDQR